MEETTRMDIRRLLKQFGVKADELIMAQLTRSPEVAPLHLRITLEDLTEYGPESDVEPVTLQVEGEIGGGK